jgi:hypothetical protein
MNGMKGDWIQWDTLVGALREIEYRYANSGEHIIKKIVIRRRKQRGG